MDLSITHLQLRPHAVIPHCSETYQDMSACFPNGYARRTMSTCLPGVGHGKAGHVSCEVGVPAMDGDACGAVGLHCPT